ncbi:MAG: hypothetical protein WCG47_20755 [Dermatophilaceae bacterium]
MPPRQLTWAIDLTGALAGFLAIAGTSAPAAGADVDTVPAVAAGIVGMARDGYAGIRAKDLLRSGRQACEWNKTMFCLTPLVHNERTPRTKVAGTSSSRT